MNKRALLNLLAEHADGLSCEDGGGMETAVFLSSLLTDLPPSLTTLFHLACAVKQALIPVTPSPTFKAQLKQELTQVTLTERAGRSIGKLVWLGAAIVFSIVGLVMLIVRWLKGTDLKQDIVTTAVS